MTNMIDRGFYKSILPRDPNNLLKNIHRHLLNKVYKQKPHLLEMVKVKREGFAGVSNFCVDDDEYVWDRKYKEELVEVYNKLVLRARKIAPRYERLINFCANKNLEKLVKLNTSDAFEALKVFENGCLKWYECLPMGIDPQVAARKTNNSFFLDNLWVRDGAGRQMLESVLYTPENSKKFKSYAKKI